MISFRAVSKSFGDKHVLREVSFDVQAGEVFFIIGASGVGKSVLIKHLIGLLRPDSGEIWLEGEEVSRFDETRMYPVRKKCAMVFQHATLFDSMTCAENVALPLRKHGDLSRKQAMVQAEDLLRAVEMADFAGTYPGPLGDGQRKRVAVARALALRPRYVLFDEPTTSLDPISARRVDRLIASLAAQHGVTCVVVSHDLKSIFTIADRIAMLYKGEVRLLGTRDDFRHSHDPI